MKVKFLKHVDAEVHSHDSCGDGCCYYPKWVKEFFPMGEEVEAVADKSNFAPDGTITLEGLKFNEDYIITEFP